MRQLKHHEQRLLRKVDFIQWKSDQNIREVKVLRRYHIQRREDYAKYDKNEFFFSFFFFFFSHSPFHRYNKMCGMIRALANKLSALESSDPTRIVTTDLLLDKLYNMALITTKKSLSQCEKLNASAFCRRRLPVVLVRLKMAETVKAAVTLVEHGHVRVGPERITDPAFLVTRVSERSRDK